MSINDIKTKVKRCITYRFGISFENQVDDYWDQHLCGGYWDWKSRDLLYFYHDLEDIFGITFPPETVISGEFTSLNRIVRLIAKQKTVN